jgi:sugar-phosphatase
VSGAADLLASLPLHRWAVATSAGRDLAIRRIVGVGLPAPGVLVGADMVARGKPDPEGYRRAAAALGVTPDQCVVFEDTPAGVQAGRAAGAVVIGLLTTYPTLEGCDAVVSDLRAVRVVEPAGDRIRLEIAGSSSR